jgi:hypothetical protein
LILIYQKRFHIEPLLILDHINWAPAFGLESLGKISFPLNAAAVGQPRKRLVHTLQPPGPIIIVATAVPGPLHRHHRPRAGISSMQLLRPFIDTAIGAPPTSPYRAASPPPHGLMPPPRRPRLLRSHPSLPRHQRLLWPWSGPLPMKQRAPTNQASIGDRLSGELSRGHAHHVLYFSLILLFISVSAYFIS